MRVHIPNTLRDVCDVLSKSHRSWSFGGALEQIAKEGKGVAVLLSSKDLSGDLGQDIVSTIARERMPAERSQQRSDLTIGTGSQILRDLGVGKMRLLSYPGKFNAVSGFDLEVVEFVPFKRQEK